MMKQAKGLTKDELDIRGELVLSLPERIQAIPDGTSPAANQSGGMGSSTGPNNIKFDSGNY